jgi:hypothetical protein
MSRVANTEWSLRATTDETGMWRCEGLIGGVEYRFQVEARAEEGTIYGRGDSVTAVSGETVEVGEIKLGALGPTGVAVELPVPDYLVLQRDFVL